MLSEVSTILYTSVAVVVRIKVRATFSATCHKEHLDGLGDEAIAPGRPVKIEHYMALASSSGLSLVATQKGPGDEANLARIVI